MSGTSRKSESPPLPRQALIGRVKLGKDGGLRRKFSERTAKLMDNGSLFVYQDELDASSQRIDLRKCLKMTVDDHQHHGSHHGEHPSSTLLSSSLSSSSSSSSKKKKHGKSQDKIIDLTLTLHSYHDEVLSTSMKLDEMNISQSRRDKVMLQLIEDSSLWLSQIERFLPEQKSDVCKVLWNGPLLKQSDYLKKMNQRWFVLASSKNRRNQRLRFDFAYFHDSNGLERFLGTVFCHRPTYKEILSEHTKGWIRLDPSNMRVSLRRRRSGKDGSMMVDSPGDLTGNKDEDLTLEDTESMLTDVSLSVKIAGQNKSESDMTVSELQISIDEVDHQTGRWITLLKLKSKSLQDLTSCFSALQNALQPPPSDVSSSKSSTSSTITVTAAEGGSSIGEDTKDLAGRRSGVRKRSADMIGEKSTSPTDGPPSSSSKSNGEDLKDIQKTTRLKPPSQFQVQSDFDRPVSLHNTAVFEDASERDLWQTPAVKTETANQSKSMNNKNKMCVNSKNEIRLDDSKKKSSMVDQSGYYSMMRNQTYYRTEIKSRDIIAWVVIISLWTVFLML